MSATDLLQAEQLGRPPARPVPYPWWTRRGDSLAGFRDGLGWRRHGGSAEHPVAQAWLDGVGHAYAERDRRDKLDAEARAAELAAELTGFVLMARRADARIAKILQEHHEAAGAGPDLDRRPAETADPDGVVRLRRQREFSARLAAVQARVAAATGRQDALVADAAATAARIEVLFDVTRSRSDHLKEYHQRRSSRYLRSYRRIGQRKSAGGQATWPEDRTPTSVWTDIPACPWSAELRAYLRPDLDPTPRPDGVLT